MSTPQLAPGKSLQWTGFNKQPQQYSDDSDSDDHSLSYEESDHEQNKAGEVPKRKSRASRMDPEDNTEEVWELKKEIESLKVQLNAENDAKLALASQLDSATYSMNKMRSYVGTTLLLGVLESSNPGPFATLVEKDDRSSRSNIRQVVAGGNHSLLLTADGDVYAWGRGQEGQLGIGDANSYSQPTKVLALKKIKFVAAGDNVSFAVTENNNVYAWGDNTAGQLGIGDDEKKDEPTLVKGLPQDAGIVQISCGKRHTVFLTDQGEVWATGSGQFSQNGQKKKDLRTPQRVPNLEEFNIVHAQAGDKFTIMIAEGDISDPKTYEPEPTDYKAKVELLSRKATNIVRARDEYLKRFAVDMDELMRACERQKREISSADASGGVAESAALLDALAKVINVAEASKTTAKSERSQSVGVAPAAQPASSMATAAAPAAPAGPGAPTIAAPPSILLSSAPSSPRQSRGTTVSVVTTATMIPPADKEKAKEIQARLQRAMKDGNEGLVAELNKEIQRTIDASNLSDEQASALLAHDHNLKFANEVKGWWDQVRETSLSELSRRKDADDNGQLVSVRDIIRESNSLLTDLTARIGAAVDGELHNDEGVGTNPNAVMAGLLIEAVQTRKMLNDYTEGLLLHTVRKLEDYKGRGKKQRNGFMC